MRCRMCKCATYNALAHSHICAEMPYVGIEPATMDPVARHLRNLQNGPTKTAPAILQTQKRKAARPGRSAGNRAPENREFVENSGVGLKIANFGRNRKGGNRKFTSSQFRPAFSIFYFPDLPGRAAGADSSSGK